MDDDLIRRAVDEIGDELDWDEDARQHRARQIQAFEARTLASAPASLFFATFRRQPFGWERLNVLPARETLGVAVLDDYGDTEYQIILEGDDVTYFSVRAVRGAVTEPYEWGEQPRELPRDLVVRLVHRYMRGELPGDGDSIPRADAFDVTTTRGRKPHPSYVAEIIRSAARRGVSPRAALMARSGKSTATVDRWIREARAADPTLPQAKRNPGPRKPKNDGESR